METGVTMEKKLDNIEMELYNLKSVIIKVFQQQETNKIVKLKGLLKNIVVNEDDIKEAKMSLFKVGA